MKKLIIVFVLLLSALSCFSQIEFSTCLFDASRNRVIPLAVYQPHKVNSKQKSLYLATATMEIKIISPIRLMPI